MAVGVLRDSSPVIAGGDGSVRVWRLADGTRARPSTRPASTVMGRRPSWQHHRHRERPGHRHPPARGSMTIRNCFLFSGPGRPTRPSDNGRLSSTSTAVASTVMLMARNGHKSAPSLVRTPRCDADSFVTMSHASTSGRRSLVRILAVTESEHPASATTRHLVHNADYARLLAASFRSAVADRIFVLVWFLPGRRGYRATIGPPQRYPGA